MKLKFLSLALLTVAAGNAQAAQWTGSDSFAVAGGSAVMAIGFTGDGITSSAQVDIAVPRAFPFVSVTGRNGALCKRITGTRIVRVLLMDPSSRPLPSVPLNHCDIRVTVPNITGTHSFPMGNPECYDAYGNPAVSCSIDPGSIHVIAP